MIPPVLTTSDLEAEQCCFVGLYDLMSTSVCKATLNHFSQHRALLFQIAAALILLRISAICLLKRLHLQKNG